MAQRRELPELWDKILEGKGISSLRHLARVTNLSPATLSRAVHGDSEPSDDTVRTVADALGLELPAAYKLFGDDSPEAAQYVPPAEANRLTTRQRRAIDDLIRAITAEREEDEEDATQAEDEAGRDPDVQGARDRAPMSPDYYALAADDSPSEGDRQADEAGQRGEGPQ